MAETLTAREAIQQDDDGFMEWLSDQVRIPKTHSKAVMARIQQIQDSEKNSHAWALWGKRCSAR